MSEQVPIYLNRNWFVDISDQLGSTDTGVYAVAVILGLKEEEDVWAVCRLMNAIETSEAFRKLFTIDTT